MSSYKIQRNIELLEQQLKEIETEISDPIERIEQKKQLEKKIRKLKQSKNQREQFEKEQQELESLKSEFSLNNNDSVDERELKKSEQVEHISESISPVTDNFIAKIPEINLNKQVKDDWNSQVDNTDPWEENSDNKSPVTSPSNNSKEFGKAWIIGGMIGFFIFLGLIINGHQVNQTASNIEQQTSESVEVEKSSDESLPSTETYQQTDTSNLETESDSQSIPSFTQQEAVNLLERWQNAKNQIFASPFNRELGAELLTGKAYYDNIGNPEGSVAWLQDNASYYTYGFQSIDSVENFAVTENYATIEAVITEQRTLYNQYGKIDRNASGFDTRLVRYNLESENGQWKITDYQTTETYQQTDTSNLETENASQSIPSFTQQEAVNLLERWQNAKNQIFASPFNRELGAELLTGKAYYDNIGNPEGSVAWLQDNVSYYTYGVQSIDSVENFAVTENYATIEAVITEQRTLYNQYGKIDRNASGFDTRLVRYNLESENGQWKIADYQTIRKIK